MLEVTIINKKKNYNDNDPDLDVIYPESQGVSWITPGQYSFVVPEGITSICGVAIGASSSSYSKGAQAIYGSSSGGGGLGWANSIAVTPGETLIVEVGAPGNNINMGDTVKTYPGGRSCLRRGATVLFAGNGATNGGEVGTGTSIGGTYVGQGGGNGGNGIGYNYYTSGGGGAGGYSGNGGNGGSLTGGTLYATGGNGGGGGGAGGENGTFGRGGRGGGTGLFGQGNNGLVANAPSRGGGHGSYTKGTGSFGGGGSLSSDGINTAVLGRGGAVRVLWAVGNEVRAFPSNNVGPI